MEQQAQLRDALNEALKHEAERLRMATGEMMECPKSFKLGMPSMQYNPSVFYSVPQQQNMQLPSYHQSQGNMHHMNNIDSHNMNSHGNQKGWILELSYYTAPTLKAIMQMMIPQLVKRDL
ncbi:hypothetical protein BVRB_7g158130 [Beta vulgaris subsp. vulgaris]|nr:hypothetical protein BVRB_7g158130 [Beta vulgaris subsp. vulgaris]